MESTKTIPLRKPLSKKDRFLSETITYASAKVVEHWAVFRIGSQEEINGSRSMLTMEQLTILQQSEVFLEEGSDFIPEPQATDALPCWTQRSLHR